MAPTSAAPPPEIPDDVLTVCVSGAAGQLAYAVLPLLASGATFGATQRIRLQLLEVTPALGALHGVAMELEDGSYPLLHSVLETDDAATAFSAARIVVLIGAARRKAGMERSDLLRANALIFRTQGAALAKSAHPDVRVLVVGNPANTNALLISDAAKGAIPPAHISALTRLDHNRARAAVARRLRVPAAEVQGVCVWGNHSSTQYPDVTRATVSGKPVTAALGGHSALAADLIPEVQKRGSAVIEARGLSSAMSAAKAICDHLKAWIVGDEDIVSMAVPADGSYGIEPGVYYSFPVRCRGGGKHEIVRDLEIDAFSREYLDASANELHAERAEALALGDASM